MNKRLLRAQELLAHHSFDEAESLCRSSMRLGKDVALARKLLAVVLYNRSVALSAHSDMRSEVEALLREACALDSHYFDALNNLGALLISTFRSAEAIPFLQRCLTGAASTRLSALRNLALAYQESGQCEEASQCLLSLAKGVPEHSALYLIRDALLLPVVPASDDALKAARLLVQDKLSGLLQRTDLRTSMPLSFPTTYFPLTYHGEPNTEINRALAQAFLLACPSLGAPKPPSPGSSGYGRRIRIGIISAFLHEHSVGKVCRGFVEHIDKTRFEIVTIRLRPSPNDAVAIRFDQCSDRVLDLSSCDLEHQRSQISQLHLDVLFYQDIGMEPQSYFLALARLAPLQMTWFGHPDTTGIPNMDYFLSWEKFEPADGATHYTEQLVCSKAVGNIAYYHRPSGENRKLERGDFGFSDADTLYCCAQQAYKLMPVMDRLFGEIIRRDTSAKIVLFEPFEKHLRSALEQRFMAQCPELMNHVCFLPMQPYADYLRVLQLSDVVLDSVLFNGYNTTLDALAMGTPVVTRAGKTMRDRFGYGLYTAMGLPELISETDDEYGELACRVVHDKVFRENCRAKINAGSAMLFEDISAVREFERVVLELVAACDKKATHT